MADGRLHILNIHFKTSQSADCKHVIWLQIETVSPQVRFYLVHDVAMLLFAFYLPFLHFLKADIMKTVNGSRDLDAKLHDVWPFCWNTIEIILLFRLLDEVNKVSGQAYISALRFIENYLCFYLINSLG